MLMGLPMMLGLAACTEHDNPVAPNPLAAQVQGMWWAMYDEEGKTFAGDEYHSVIQVLNFNDDGTGWWSLLFFNDDSDEPMERYGGKSSDGGFTYTTSADGTVNFTLNDDWDMQYYPNQLRATCSGGIITVTADGKTRQMERPDEGTAAWLRQVSTGGNADIIETSNKIYAVGFSYDCMGEYASPNSVKLEVFDTKALIEDGVLAVNATQVELSNNTVTGSSISEMTNKLAVKASVSGGFGAFKAEANSSFDMEHTQNNNYEYASTYLDLAVRRASLNLGLEALKDEYMTDQAWNDINGVPVKNKRGITKVAYPSTKAGFKQLIQQYGTHVVVRAGLGGRLRRSLEIDVTKITSAYDVKAFAKASYSGIFTKTEGSVDEQFKQSYEDNKKNISITMSVLGGDESMAKALGTEAGFTADNFTGWMNSVTTDNMALVSFEENSLVPLYELIERNATEENGGFDGEARYQALKAYMNGEDIASDFSTYNCGTVTEFEIPSFDDAKYNSTFIKDIYIDGQFVGQVCNEYVPNIDRTKRVNIVYPVINNQPRYNMGFFLGNRTHKPARVSWSGTNVAVEEYSELDFVQVTKLYLRGASISPTLYEGTTAMKATDIKDEYLEGRRQVIGKFPEVGYYPLVKIFDKVWTREEYNGASLMKEIEFTMDGETFIATRSYYSYEQAKDDSNFPSGWKVASHEDYQNMKDKLNANGHSMPGLALLNGGVTGFELYWCGRYWFYSSSAQWEYPGEVGIRQQGYWTSDGHYSWIGDTGTFEISAAEYHIENVMSCVRLVKK